MTRLHKGFIQGVGYFIELLEFVELLFVNGFFTDHFYLFIIPMNVLVWTSHLMIIWQTPPLNIFLTQHTTYLHGRLHHCLPFCYNFLTFIG